MPPTKPSVHYLDDLGEGAAPAYNSVKVPRVESGDMLSSKAPSLAGTDDEEDDEIYNWSDEDDLVDQEAKYEQHIGLRSEAKKWGVMKIITFFFSTLVGSTITAGLIVVGPILLHIFYLEKNRTVHRQYVTDTVSAWLFWAAANLLVSWYLALIVDIIPAVVTSIVSLAWGHVSQAIKSRVEMYVSVKDVFKPLLYAASAWVSWVILFANIYDLYDMNNESQSRAPYTPRVYQAVEFLFFLALVISAQRMLSHMIAFAFHRVAYKDRMDAVKIALKTIDHLRDYRPKRTNCSGSATPGTHDRSSRLLATFHLGGFGGTSSAPASVGGTPYHEKSEFMAGHGDDEHSPMRGPPRGHTASDTLDYHADGESDDQLEMKIRRKREKGKGQGHLWWPRHHRDSKNSKDSAASSPGAVLHASPHSSSPVSGGALNTSVPPLHTYPPQRSPASDPSHSNANSPGTLAPPHVGTPQSRRSQDGDVDVAATVSQAAKALGAAVLHDARNLTGHGDEDGPAGLGWSVNTAHDAKRLAKSIYLAFKADRKRKYLIPQDFYPAYATPQEAEDAFRVFDKDNNGDISRAEIKTIILKIYKERRFLSRSMRDVGEALRTLDQVLLMFALVVLFFISLSVFNVNVGASLTSVYSLAIAASFIFKNAAGSAFDAIMFLFVTHPYDTGDRCVIEEENLVVKKMGLFATIFTRVDGTETYYFNSQLFTKFITNVRRSGKTAENLTMQVAWRTPLAKLDALEKSMNEWLQTEQNRWFEPSTSVTLQKIDFQRHLEITIGIGHNGNWQDWGLRLARKTAFHAAMNYFCHQLGITAAEAPMPIAYGVQALPEADLDVDAPVPDSALPGDENLPAMKPMLGFLPPPEKRNLHLRARKSKRKNGAIRAMGVGDG
ncbi:hypothetical protein BD410DRAFT_817773 [Rickenella mellea]|uniref:EF-hand domain-containing protein n=1 Tax=Rickenella mellea TaxID=50990 RepID=A0A4R5XF80_9AGAM|nr:hypothetical protein BD410DRAFT_817773 [Rickenella mellea]